MIHLVMRGALRRLLVAAACVLPLLAAGSVDATSAPTLSIEGPGNTSALLDLNRTTTLHFDLNRGGLSLSGGKTYVGMALHDRAGTLLAAAVHPKAFTADGRPFYLWLGRPSDRLVLEPGRYRVTLLGDGAARATVRAPGLGSSTRLTTRAAVRGIDAAVLPLQAPMPTVTSGSAELNVTADSTFGLFTFEEKDAPAHTRRWFCLRPQPASCSASDHDFTASDSAISVGSGWVSTSAFSTSGAPAGSYLAGTGAATVSARAREAAFAISIPGAHNRER